MPRPLESSFESTITTTAESNRLVALGGCCCVLILQYKTVLYKIRDLCYNKETTIMGAL